jgi:hypothetical protein
MDSNLLRERLELQVQKNTATNTSRISNIDDDKESFTSRLDEVRITEEIATFACNSPEVREP